MAIRFAPNFITLLRVLLIPPIIMLMHIVPLVSFGLFIIAVISDKLDGHIARRYQVASRTGALLDAIADKIFYISILWWLTPLVPFSIFILACIPELLLVAVRFPPLREWCKTTIPATKSGKIKMAVHCTALGFLLPGAMSHFIPFQHIGIFLVLTGVLLSINSLYSHIRIPCLRRA